MCHSKCVKSRFLHALLLTTFRIEVINIRRLKGCNLIAVCLVLYIGELAQIFPGIVPLLKRCGLNAVSSNIYSWFRSYWRSDSKMCTRYKEHLNLKDLCIH